MAEPIEINVVTDDKGSLAPELGATVSIVERSAVGDITWPYNALPFTHTHHQNGFYRALSGKPDDEPGAGEWLLVVSLGGKSPVVQRITLKDKGGILIIEAGWGVAATKQLAHTALTVSIVNYDQVSGASAGAQAKRSRIIVRLLPRMELVSMGCADRAGGRLQGTRYDAYAKGRANLLHADGELNDGVIHTLFTVMSRTKEVLVKSRSPSADDWIVVGLEKGAEVKKGTKRPDTPNEQSIVDFYRHLHYVGKGAPGTVLEAGIYGHAYIKGPIVWNTSDRAVPITARDPRDLDGRNKDWVAGAEVISWYPDMRDAFMPDRGSLRVWGCNHMPHTLMEIAAAKQKIDKKAPRNEFFQVTLPIGRENLTLDHLKRNVAQFIVSTRVGHTLEFGDAAGIVAYCGAACQSLQLPCWGAPPGMGANLGFRSQQPIMFIQDQPKTENDIPMRWYEVEFGQAFKRDKQNYIDFNEMRKAPLPDPGWATERYIIYHDDNLDQQILRLPSGLEVYRKPRDEYKDPTPMTLGGVTGHLYVAPLARVKHVQDRDHRILMLDPSTTDDVGIFVGKDGKSMLLKSPKGKNSFTLDTSTVEVHSMIFRGGRQWGFSLNPPGTLTGSTLQTVVPAWYW